MKQPQLPNLFLDESTDHIWIINLDSQLIYANKRWLNLVKEVTGKEQKLYESAFVEGFGEGYVKKWKGYYERALKGESLEIEEHYSHPETNDIHYGQITIKPLRGDDNEIFAVACQSRDITSIIKNKSEAHQLIDASLDVFCTINEQGNFVFVSAAALGHWGYMPQELTGQPYVNFILEEDVPKSLQIATAILGGQDIKSFVNRYKKKDGGIAYNLWSVTWNKTSKLMYCVVRDAKEIIEQEEQIQQSEQRFKALVQEGSDMIAILDEEGNYRYASPTSLSVLGIPHEEFIGKNAFEFVHPKDAERTLGALQKIATENTVILEPFRFQNHKKEWRWLETVLTNMLDNPAVKGIVANSRDITDKIEEEHQLKLLKSVITNTRDAILITEAEPFDEPGPKIIYVNDAFTKMTGYEPEEVIGKSPRMLEGPNSDKEELLKLDQALRKWEPYEMTTINYKKSGEEFWINFSVTPVANEKGWYTHWIAIERDVTEQKIKELEKDLIAKISDIFHPGVANNLTECLTNLCEHITEFGDFDFAEIWLPAIDAKTINRVSTYVKGEAGITFYNTAKDLDCFTLGEALPGQIWTNKMTEIWADLDNQWQFFQRKAAAKKAGIHAMMGVPLKHNDEIVGVLLLGTQKTKAALALHLELFQKLESTIGAELSRKNIEIELAQIFNFTPDMICVSGFDGYLKRINPAGLELLGYSIEEMRSRPIKSFIHVEDRLNTIERQNVLYRGGNVRNFENRYITKGGDVVWLSWTASPAPEHGIVYSVAKNITEEKKLRELNRQAGRLAKIGSWEMDLVNQSLFWSEEVHHMHETDPLSFVPDLEIATNFYREDFQQLVQVNIQNTIATGEPFDFEAVIVTANKKERWVRIIGSTEMVDGKPTRIFGSFQDINSLKDTEIRLHSLSDNLPGVVYQYLVYPDGTDAIRYLSGGAEELWGYETNKVMENTNLIWRQIKMGGDFDEVQASISKSIHTKSKWTNRFKYVMPNGELRTHLGYGIPSFLADGTILFNSIVLDVTQESRNEELLKQITKIARIGSWEMDLVNQDGEDMYWSPMLYEIVEVDDDYNPTLTGGIEFHIGESKERIQNALNLLITNGTEFDEEILLLTAKGQERWSRAIGKSEMVNNKRVKIYGSYQDIHLSKSLELKISEILGSISDAFYAMDKDWKFTYFNSEAERLLQREENEVIGKKIWDIFPSAVNTKLHEAYYTITQTLVSQSFEYLYPGDDRWYEVSAYPSAGGLSVYFKNINDRKVAAEKLQKAYEEKNNILESIGDAFFAVDNNWIVTYWNKEAELVLDRKKELIIGKHLWEEYSDAIDSDFYREYHKAVETKQVTSFEAHYPTLNIWIEVSAYPAEEGLSVYFKDVTLRKEADIRLELANERFEKVTEATNDAIWDWDIVNKSFYRSKAIEKFLGKQASQSFTEKEFWKDSFHPNDLTTIKNSVEDAISDPERTRWELEYRLFNELGKTLYVIDRGVIIRNNAGEAIRMVGAMTDVTEQKHMELQLTELNQSLQQYAQELERSNEELEQFAFVASHDLQEPLRMISSFMDLLQRKYGDQLDEKAHQYIHFATDGAKRMKQIILDLLEYSRATRPTEGKEAVDLNEVLSEFKQLRRKVISEKFAKIISDNLPTLTTHRAVITQILHCLVDNALKYTEDGTAAKVEIKAVENEGAYKFSIKDNGIGIESQFYDKIFIIFQRLHNQDQFAGTGIGLSIAKRHVEFLGGRIWLESEPNKGSIFYFTIPNIK